MSDGVKIRELDPTNVVSANDVLIIDKDSFGDNSLTYYIEYQDFRKSVFTGDVTLDGKLTVDGDFTVTGDTKMEGSAAVEGGDLVVSHTTNTKDLYVSGHTNLGLGDLSNVEIGGVQANHYLMYDGNNWVPGEGGSGGGGGGGTQTDDYIILEGGSDEIVFTVTVAAKTPNNQFYGIGSNNCFYIDGKESPILMLPPNRKFVFDQSDPSNFGLRMMFSEEQSEGVLGASTSPGTSYEGTPGVAGAKSIIEFTSVMDGFLLIDSQTPEKLYYRTENANAAQKYMGAVIHNLGSSVKTDVLDDGGSLFPYSMTLMEALQDLNTRLETIETSS